MVIAVGGELDDRSTAQRGVVLVRGDDAETFSFDGRTYNAAGTLRVPTTAPQAIRDLTFVTDPDEVLTVRDARSGDIVAVYQPEEGGFVRGSQRGIGRDRKLLGIAADEPYRLILWDDGRLTISDTKTGQRFPLDAFGPTNSAAFARLLDDRRNTR